MKEMISTLREACKENPGEVINSVLFLIGIFGFTYIAFWIHANIIY
jgi:hypothetical protein